MTTPSLFDYVPASAPADAACRKVPQTAAEHPVTATCRDCNERRNFSTVDDANRFHDGHRVAIML